MKIISRKTWHWYFTGTVAFLIGSCSTFRTCDGGGTYNAKPASTPFFAPAPAAGSCTIPPKVKDVYGQPYFLPKGLIHLVITPLSPATGSGTTSITGSNSISNYSTVGDTGVQPLAYSITVQRVLVPDMTAGPYIARYEQNWLYAENISIGVDDNGLLMSGSSTSTDQTSKAILNVVQTAADIAEFISLGGFGAGGVPGGAPSNSEIKYILPEKLEEKPTPPPESSPFPSPISKPPLTVAEKKAKKLADAKAAEAAKEAEEAKEPRFPDNIRYNRLNIDVTFDPSDEDQCSKVKNLFNSTWRYDPRVADLSITSEPHLRTDYNAKIPSNFKGGKIFLISPFKLDVKTAITPDGAINSKSLPQNPGLWFRETSPVEIIITPNSEEFRETARNVLTWDQNVVKRYFGISDPVNPQTFDALNKALQEVNDQYTKALNDENYAIADLTNYQKIIATFSLASGSSAITTGTTIVTGTSLASGTSSSSSGTSTTTPASGTPTTTGTSVSSSGSSSNSGTNSITTGTTTVSSVANLYMILDKLKQAKIDADIATQHRLSTEYDATVATNVQTVLTGLRDAVFTPPTNGQGMDFVVSLPDPGRVFSFNFARSAFVQNKQTNLTISCGMLTNVAINKPSEIEGATELPLNIIQTIMQIPENLLTLRTQNLTGQNNLLTQETNLVNGQSALSNAQKTAASQQTTAQIGAQTAQAQAQAAQVNAQAQAQAAQINAQAAQTQAQAAQVQALINLLNLQQTLKQTQTKAATGQ